MGLWSVNRTAWRDDKWSEGVEFDALVFEVSINHVAQHIWNGVVKINGVKVTDWIIGTFVNCVMFTNQWMLTPPR